MVAAPFIAGSAFLTADPAFNRDATATMAVTVSAFVGLLMYASVFVWLGLVTKQAIGVGLLYIVLWEGFFSGYIAASLAASPSRSSWILERVGPGPHTATDFDCPSPPPFLLLSIILQLTATGEGI